MTMGCPCQDFRSAEEVLSAIKSATDTERLIGWLRGDEISAGGEEFAVSREQGRPCDAAKNGRCPHRVGAAFVILNAVRDGCRRYLDTPSVPLSTTSAPASSNASTSSAPTPPSRAEPTFESSFPSLQSASSSATPNVLVGRKKQKPHSAPSTGHPRANNFPVPKSGNWATAARGGAGSVVAAEGPSAKRRIRPVPAAGPSGSPWASSGSSVAARFPAPRGNIANLPSEDPAEVRKPPQPPGTSRTDGSKRPGMISRDRAPRGAGRQVPKSGGWGKQSNADVSASQHPVAVAEVRKLSGGCPQSITKKQSRDDDSALLGRLVDMYVEVIQNLLAPSTPLELHLLIRILSVDASKTFSDDPEVDGNGEKDFLFSSGRVCRNFACDALSRLRSFLLNLGHEIIKSLVALPPMMDFLPEIVLDLRCVVEQGSKDRILESSHMVGNDTLQLTVPFDQTRDSRHNYRSRDQTVLFTNREESRDKFMYQLRAFQEIRGTVVDPSQAEMYIEEIKKACRDMVHGLLPGNMFWFAEFFCDLLLQIGLVPMEETDKEILKSVDKDRLKKLHRRFTSKGSQKSKSSQKLSLDRKSQAFATSSTAQGHFSGHQEFFYIFLLSVDSYHFGVHLRRRLAGLIASMNSVDEIKCLEQRVAKLQLLAKFLGMLVFSPNWSTVYEDPSSSTNLALSTASEDALAQMNCTVPIIPLRKYIEEGWRECRLLVVIPWVVEFLRMAMWDNLSVEASYYRDVFSLLRSIHKKLGQGASTAQTSFCSNMQLVAFQLETLFADVVGLSKSERLPEMRLSRRDRDRTSVAHADAKAVPAGEAERTELDMLPLWFSKTFLFASSSHLEELHKLIVDLTHNKRSSCSGTGTPKKLRPYAISSDISNDSTGRILFPPVSPSPALAETDPGRRASHPSAQGTRLLNRNESGIRGKLVDTFFHQHRDLQQLCEFLVGWSVKNVSIILVRQCISPILESKAPIAQSRDLESYIKLIHSIEEETKTAASKMMQQKTEWYISESMKVLCPPLTNPEVRDIATTLALQYACQNGEAVIGSLVRLEVKKRIDQFAKKEAKTAIANQGTQLSVAQDSPAFHNGQERQPVKESLLSMHLEPASSALGRLLTVPANDLWKASDEAHRILSDANSCICEAFVTKGYTETDLTKNDPVKLFGMRLMSLLRLWFSKQNEERRSLPPLLLSSFKIVVSLHRIGFVLRELIENCVFVCEPRRLKMMINWCDCSERGENEACCAAENNHNVFASQEGEPMSRLEEVGVMLVEMVESRLISASTLERSLIRIFEQHVAGQSTEAFSWFCIRRLRGAKHEDKEWMSEKALVMSRLRKKLMRQRRDANDSSRDDIRD